METDQLNRVVLYHPRIKAFVDNHPSFDLQGLIVSIIDNFDACILSTKGESSVNHQYIVSSLQTSIHDLLAPHLVTEQSALLSIQSQLSQLTNITKTPVHKGRIAERSYLTHLNQLFPQSEIQDCSMTPHSMDILLREPSFTDIRFDIKDYTTNVPSKELIKFKEDIIANSCHGVLVSHNSGIATKSNFAFEVLQNKFIAFYFCHGSSQLDMLPTVVSFIRCLETVVSKQDGVVLTPAILHTIQSQIDSNVASIQTIKKNLQHSVQLLNSLTLTSILDSLSLHHSTNTLVQQFPCQICDCAFDTKRKLTNHMRSHS